MEKIFEINRKKIFSLPEANDIVPVLVRVTKASQLDIKKAMALFDAIADKSSAAGREAELEINQIIDRWHSKVEKLGGQPKGLWLADFDFGGGYYCWKYPETEIKFWHGYKDGFSGRKEITHESWNSADQSHTGALQT